MKFATRRKSTHHTSGELEGVVRLGKRTKALTGRIQPGEMVIIESERAISIKSPRNIPVLHNAILSSNLTIVRDPSNREVEANLYLIHDPNNVPILLAAMKAKVDYLATHNRRHFLDDPDVSERSGIKIGNPGDILAWLRENFQNMG